MRIQLSGCAIVNEQEELLLLWKKKHQHYEFPVKDFSVRGLTRNLSISSYSRTSQPLFLLHFWNYSYAS